MIHISHEDVRHRPAGRDLHSGGNEGWGFAGYAPSQLRVFAVPHLGCAVCHYVLEIETEKAVV